MKKWRVMVVLILDTQEQASRIAGRLNNELEDIYQDHEIEEENVSTIEEIEED